MAESSRTYSVVGKNLTITGAVTLAFINPGVSATLEVLRVMISQYGTTLGQQLGIQLGTQPSVFPTLVAATPAQWSTSDPISKIVGATTGAAGTCGLNFWIWRDAFDGPDNADRLERQYRLRRNLIAQQQPKG